MEPQQTCWTLIDAAAEPGSAEREAFVERYHPLIRAYLGARWNSPPLSQEIGDACQDFFVDCFREGGPLERVEKERKGGFRAYLYGMARVIALRWEERFARQKSRPVAVGVELGEIASDETEMSRVFDRAWARTILQEAGKRHREQAERDGVDAVRRVELLELRFRDGLPIRKIAELWGEDVVRLHHEYAKARDEYSQALHEVVSFHHPDGAAGEIRRECVELLTALR